MRKLALALAITIPMTATAQTALFGAGNPMTQPVTPRDIPYYMAHPDLLDATLRVCHSNAAYGVTPDCQNAERASIGLMTRQKQRVASSQASAFYSPEFWDQNPIMRETVLTQCRRRGPGDQIAYPYCQVAAESQLRMLNR